MMPLTKSNLSEVQQFLLSDEANAVPPATMRETLHACLGMLASARTESAEYKSLMETLRESNAQLKDIVTASQTREDSLAQALSAVETLSTIQTPSHEAQLKDLRARHQEQLNTINDRIATQKREFTAKLAHMQALARFT